jgi:sialate O-acetylesterase
MCCVERLPLGSFFSIFVPATLAAAALAALTVCPVAAASGPSISLRSPHPYQVIQRGERGTADILVVGVLRGISGRVLARWGHGAWTSAQTAEDGSFAIRLRSQPAGQAEVVVRSARRPSVSATCDCVGVGDIYVIAGQSNASGRSPYRFAVESTTITATAFGNDYQWQPLRDPTDSAARQRDLISRDLRAGGSVWPLVASTLMRLEDVPVAFVPCARGSTAIAYWRPERSSSPAKLTLYQSMMRRIRAVGGRVRAVLFWQGEADARLGTPRRVYERRLLRLAQAVYHDCGAPLVVAQIGNCRPDRCTATAVTGIRAAQSNAWGRRHVVAGPQLYDIDLRGGVHFVRAAEVRLAAKRWATSILGGVLGHKIEPSPHLYGASYDGLRTVRLVFATESLPLRGQQVDGIVVEANGRRVAVVRETAQADTVTITLKRRQHGRLRVSLGTGLTASGCRVPCDASRWHLPAQMFTGRRVKSAPRVLSLAWGVTPSAWS